MRNRFYPYTAVMMLLFLTVTGCSRQKELMPTESSGLSGSAAPNDSTGQSPYFAYEIDEQGKYVTILSYLDESEDTIVIPDHFEREGESYPVTEIAQDAFYNNTTIKHVTIPDTVKTIGKEAFCKCTALQEIEIPGSVENIGTGAFYDCTSLQKINIGAGVTVLPDEIFTNCENLAEVNCPDTLVSIGDEAFWGCMAMEELDLPQSLAYIGERSFYSSGLKTIIIRSATISVADGMFDGVDELENIYVPENLLKTVRDIVDDGTVEVHKIKA